jgi:hypothetical protein
MPTNISGLSRDAIESPNVFDASKPLEEGKPATANPSRFEILNIFQGDRDVRKCL